MDTASFATFRYTAATSPDIRRAFQSPLLVSWQAYAIDRIAGYGETLVLAGGSGAHNCGLYGNLSISTLSLPTFELTNLAKGVYFNRPPAQSPSEDRADPCPEFPANSRQYFGLIGDKVIYMREALSQFMAVPVSGGEPKEIEGAAGSAIVYSEPGKGVVISGGADPRTAGLMLIGTGLQVWKLNEGSASDTFEEVEGSWEFSRYLMSEHLCTRVFRFSPEGEKVITSGRSTTSGAKRRVRTMTTSLIDGKSTAYSFHGGSDIGPWLVNGGLFFLPTSEQPDRRVTCDPWSPAGSPIPAYKLHNTKPDLYPDKPGGVVAIEGTSSNFAYSGDEFVLRDRQGSLLSVIPINSISKMRCKGNVMIGLVNEQLLCVWDAITRQPICRIEGVFESLQEPGKPYPIVDYYVSHTAIAVLDWAGNLSVYRLT